MPELPEVETVRRGLEKIFTQNNVIERVELRRPDLRVPIPVSLPKLLKNQPIMGVRRRAKYLLLDTPENIVISHLGMSGTWRVAPKGDEIAHDHVYMTLSGKAAKSEGIRLAFNDPRRFGVLDIARRDQVENNRWLKHLGVEPFDPQFNAEYMRAQAKGRSAPLKNFIMDQKVVVGVGNIYASEALFCSGLKPQRQARLVKGAEWEALIQNIRQILQTSIDKGGTTLRDHRMVDGENGDFQNWLQVYDREGELCRRCKSQIRMRVLAGRSTYWCGRCQK